MKKNYNHKQARWLLVVATLLALFVARPVKAEDNVYNGDGYSLKYIAIKNPPEGEEKRAIVIGLTDGTLDYTGHVNIPSKIENLPVRHIGVYDRMSNRVGFPKVSSIDIPSSVRTIGRGSFYGNSNLTNVKIARGGLTEILSEAFRGCVALKNIELPTTLTSIGPSAFESCKGLESIVFPESVTDLQGCLSNCTSLTEVALPKSLTTFGDGMFIKCTSLRRVVVWEGGNGMSVPAAYLKIPASTFLGCKNLEEVVWNASVTEIGKNAFNSCEKLKNYPDMSKVKTILNGAFSYSGIETFTTPASLELMVESFTHSHCLESVTITHKMTIYGNLAFADCPKLTSFVFHDDIENLNDAWYMFSGCTALEEIRLPKKLKKIDRYMFDGCTNLKRLYIGDAITEIETGSVYGTALEELHIEAPTPPTQKVSEGVINNPPFDKFAYENATVYCPDAKAYYSNYMWQRFKKYKLPEAFKYTEVEGGYSATYNLFDYVKDPTTGIDYGELFRNAYPDGKLVVPETHNGKPVVEIADNAFYYRLNNITYTLQKNISEVVLPETIRKVGKEAFNYLTDIKKVNMPSSLTEIGEYAFWSTGISEVILPDGLKTVGRNAFQYCNDLTKLVIPQSVESISGNAFYCSSYSGNKILEIICHNPTPIPLSEQFANTTYSKLRIPFGSKDAYYEADYWRDFFTKGTVVVGVGEQTLAALEITPTEEMQEGEFTVTINNSNEGAVVRYYIMKDWKMFKEISEYTGPITISETGNIDIYAIAENGDKCSPEAHQHYYVEKKTNSPCGLVTFCGMNVKDKAFAAKFGKSVAYRETKDAGVLTLSYADINAADNKYNTGINAMDGTLIVELVGNSTIAAEAYGITMGTQGPGIGGKGGNLIVRGTTGSEVLTFNISDKGMGIYAYLADVTIENCTVVVNGARDGIVMKSGHDDGYLTVRGKNTVLNLNGSNAAMENVSDLMLEDGLEIVEPENGYFSYTGSGGTVFDPGTKTVATHVVIRYVDNGLQSPMFSHRATTFAEPFELYIYNPNVDGKKNERGTVIYKVVPAGISDPSLIKEQPYYGKGILIEETSTVYAYVVDGKEQSETAVVEYVYAPNVPQIEKEQTTDFGNDLTDSDGNALTVENVVVNNVYYNLPADSGNGYDTAGKCVVVNTPMSEDAFVGNDSPATPSEGDNFEWFNGMIVVVGGTGTVEITCETVGTMVLAVRKGNDEPAYYTQSSENTVVVNYDNNTPEYLYIYAVDTAAGKKKTREVSAAADCLKIYGMKVTPTTVVTGVESIFEDSETPGERVIYDLNGRRCTEPLEPGVYIVNRKKVIIR